MKEQKTSTRVRALAGRAVRRGAYVAVQLGLDAVALVAAYLLAYLVRLDFSWSSAVRTAGGSGMFAAQGAWVSLVLLAMFAPFRVYRRMWRFMGFVDMPVFAGSFLTGGAVLWASRAFAGRYVAWMNVPYSVLFMSCVFGAAGVVGMRMLRRILYERMLRRRNWLEQGGQTGKARRVLLLGAGQAGRLMAQELARQGYARQKVVGFLDDDPDKQNQLIVGLPVLGPIRGLKQTVADYRVDEVIITIANVPRQQIQRIVGECERAGIKPRIIPALHEIACGNVPVGTVREIGIEDLLGRDVVILDSEPIRRMAEGRRVLVTGAGGSIGSELVRQVAKFRPAELLLLDQSEFALYEIHRELLKHPDEATKVVPIVADIADEARMEEIFAQWHPDGVIHAAAYKHVPMMEGNVREAATNNVFGTRNVSKLAGKYGAKVFVMVSTDKAVNPTSVMGTSKRIAELVVQAEQKEYPKTRYVSVRFGNVLGSSGSVIPLFREQIRKGGPITVTHPDIKRYFMTIPEASRLVLQAAMIGRGGEIFVLDMGTPIKIAELAKRMIELSGLKPNVDIGIQFTGLRPGEKMFEELSVRGEHAEKTRHPKIFIGKIAQPDTEWLKAGLGRLKEAVDQGEEKDIRRAMAALVPEATLEGLD
ncbi:MAG: polysaccharide biosynthesis protein [Kiritimatiellae bacterium]|nr:polysaccharide biosynthesis protein [Kiritimatiellia bacterium]